MSSAWNVGASRDTGLKDLSSAFTYLHVLALMRKFFHSAMQFLSKGVTAIAHICTKVGMKLRTNHAERLDNIVSSCASL